MFKKRKEKKRDPITDEEYRRLVELERQHGPGPSQGTPSGGGGSVGQTQPSSSSTPRAFKFSKRKDRVLN